MRAAIRSAERSADQTGTGWPGHSRTPSALLIWGGVVKSGNRYYNKKLTDPKEDLTDTDVERAIRILNGEKAEPCDSRLLWLMQEALT